MKFAIGLLILSLINAAITLLIWVNPFLAILMAVALPFFAVMWVIYVFGPLEIKEPTC